MRNPVPSTAVDEAGLSHTRATLSEILKFIFYESRTTKIKSGRNDERNR